MPQRQGETRVRAERPRRAKYPLPPPLDPIRSSRHGLSRFLPIAVFLVILGSVASGALKALGRGDRLGAIIPLVVLGVALVSNLKNGRFPALGAVGYYWHFVDVVWVFVFSIVYLWPLIR